MTFLIWLATSDLYFARKNARAKIQVDDECSTNRYVNFSAMW